MEGALEPTVINGIQSVLVEATLQVFARSDLVDRDACPLFNPADNRMSFTASLVLLLYSISKTEKKSQIQIRNLLEENDGRVGLDLEFICKMLVHSAVNLGQVRRSFLILQRFSGCFPMRLQLLAMTTKVNQTHKK